MHHCPRSKNECPSSYPGSWNDFEKQLIDFVRDNPIIYDVKPDDELHEINICNELWRQFAKKGNFSVTSCRKRWLNIKIAYFTRIKKKYPPFHDKYLDGRLSFLDRYCKIDTHEKYIETSSLDSDHSQNSMGNLVVYVNEEQTNNDSNSKTCSDLDPLEMTSKDCSSRKQSIPDCCRTTAIDCNQPDIGNIIHESETFNDDENKLIAYAKNHPILYDSRACQGDPKRRHRVKELWDSFGEATYPGVPMGSYYHKNWNKIRLEYFLVRKFAEEFDGKDLKPNLSKYLDGNLNFLNSMYEHIKMKCFHIYYKGSMEGNSYLEAVYDECHFDTVLINFAKNHNILYDVRIRHVDVDGQGVSRKPIAKNLWEELAINLNTSRWDCEMRWRRLRDNYVKHLKKNTQKGRPIFSFLNKVYGFPEPQSTEIIVPDLTEIIVPDLTPHENEKPSIRTYERTRTQSTRTSSLLNNLEDTDSLNLKKEINIHDSDFEIDEDEVRNENLEAHVNINRPQSLTTKKVDLADSTDLIGVMNRLKSNNNDFFREIGKYVADHFSETKQKEIRTKSWALVTKLELEMLQED